jgi:glycosyltransferase involved in cell wall biosynthesis
MVSRARLLYAQRSIRCFLRQTYRNRQLVVVSDGYDEYPLLRDYVRELDAHDITIVPVPRGRYTLGALRNLSIERAEGDYKCQWDDDDLYHPDRLAIQAGHMASTASHACFLSDQLQLVTRTSSLYWCDWARARESRWLCPIPNTLMCERTIAPRYPTEGDAARIGEDACGMNQLLRQSRVVQLGNVGYLYIYVTHGGNTWGEAHHQRIARVTALSAGELRAREALLTEALDAYELNLPVTVCDNEDTPLFTISRGSRLDDAPRPASGEPETTIIEDPPSSRLSARCAPPRVMHDHER